MPTVSQHYGHHAAPRTDKSALETRQAAAPVVLMVSGGADSTALLLMACTSKLDIQDGRGVAPIARERLHVLHVNHHLRGEASDGDEAFVRDLCAQYGLPLCVEHAYFDDESGNIEAAAREGLVADWVTVPGRLPLGGGRMLVTEPMAVEPGCDIVRRARELAAAGEVTALVDAAALGFADSDSERILAGSRGEIPAEARLARLWVDGPAPGDVMCPLGMSGRSKKVSDLLGEARIPVSERAGVPMVRTAPGGAVVWVAGVRADERFKCTAATRVAYLLRVVDAE